jgi:hypothetical protein
MSKWLKVFENNLEKVCLTAHENFRCFISSEPPPVPTWQIIPEPILQSSIKVANEAPQDLKANMQRAWRNFNQARLESCPSKPNEFKSILFSLCFFHSLIIGRKKFGSIGWSRIYNFNEGDLTICADVLNNYLEKYEKVPYEDLKYLYGEIMYGGHITDNWDRRTNNAYLKWLVKPELLNGVNLAPNFKSPDPSKYDYEMYRKYIEEKLPLESPILFYLHPNAEISYLTAQGETLFDVRFIFNFSVFSRFKEDHFQQTQDQEAKRKMIYLTLLRNSTLNLLQILYSSLAKSRPNAKIKILDHMISSPYKNVKELTIFSLLLCVSWMNYKKDLMENLI